MVISKIIPITHFAATFQLSRPEEIRNFFVKEKSVENKISTYLARCYHFFNTGVWISKAAILEYADAHRMAFKGHKRTISRLLKDMPLERKVQQAEAGIILSSPGYWQSSKESALFLLRFIQSSNTVGSLAPSSNQLAKTIVRQIPKQSCREQVKRLILEVGPGTGAFTDKIIKRMGPLDELHLVEYDVHFCQVLRQKYNHLIEMGKVKIFGCSILDHTPTDRAEYDFVVSGLPLNAFQADFVRQVFEKYESITKEGGKISYFEYMLLPQIIKIGMEKTARENLRKVLELKDLFYTKHEMSIDNVWKNLTPAFVRHHEMKQGL